MNDVTTSKHKFPFRKVIIASLLAGIFFGSQLSWSGIESNDGGEFSYHEGDPVVGPIVFNYGLVTLDLMVWVVACAILAFVVLSVLVLIINEIRP